MSYAGKLSETTTRRGNLCVGIDPMPSVLAAWGLTTDVKGLETCARGIVEELGERIAVFKPQSAFFEAFGSRGVAVLERVLADIREAGAISLLDVKRGDIGSSMTGYATAYLGDESPLAADAVTLSPYLGVGALLPAIDLAVELEHGNRHTAVMHSLNVSKLTKMGKLIQTTIFVKNGPSYNGIGIGGEGYPTFTIAGPTGEGLTSARSFTRKRRCVLVGDLNVR